MKQSFKTSKLYYGFPIFILGYQDQNFGHNITTCSSSYSLGDWLVIGVGAEENAVEQIKHYQKFTVNIPDENLMLEMEQAGFISHREKLKHLGLDYEISEQTYFMGDGHQRVYRYLDNRVDPMGSFIKKARMKDVKS